jgi:dCMP deaminase
MSRDDKTKVGCVIVGPDKDVVSTGFNGFPRGVDDTREERYERPAKYKWFEHGERNALYNAARRGTAMKGCIMFINAPPCSDCARGIIQCGIKRVIYPVKHAFIDRLDWKPDLDAARRMLKEAGVIISEYHG